LDCITNHELKTFQFNHLFQALWCYHQTGSSATTRRWMFLHQKAVTVATSRGIILKSAILVLLYDARKATPDL